jgi:glycosyltransferase involved in cell wall biosynthesis
MREVVQRIPEINFYSFSSPQTEEDLILGRSFWELEHIHRCRKASLLLRSFDAVHHASATPANIAASLIAKARGGGRTIHVYTASVEPHRADPYWREFAWSINHCQFLIAGSNNVARVIESSFGRTADLVLPNGVDHEFFNPSEAGEEVLAKVGRTPFVLFVGALLPRKRVDLLIRIAARMSWMHFVVVGRLSSKTNGRKTVELIDQQPNIQFLGFQPKWFVRDLMAHASVLVFPSDLEGYSNVLLEASAMGLPILARPVSSMPEIVQDGLNGWLLPDEPIGEWLARISEIAGWSKQQRRVFQTRARQLSQNHYSWDTIASKLRDFYFANIV